MGWRNTGTFGAPEEIRVLTCDVCECDIGYADGRRPRAHFQVSLHPNAGAMGNLEPITIACSRDCLRAFASGCDGPDRPTSGPCVAQAQVEVHNSALMSASWPTLSASLARCQCRLVELRRVPRQRQLLNARALLGARSSEVSRECRRVSPRGLLYNAHDITQERIAASALRSGRERANA
jgi:hypothetical protein